MHIQKYIERLDEKIDKLVRNEAEGLTDAERDLHILFENRKHAKRWKEEMHGTMPMESAHTMTTKSAY